MKALLKRLLGIESKEVKKLSEPELAVDETDEVELDAAAKELEDHLKADAAGLVMLAIETDRFYTRSFTRQIIRQHNGVISIASKRSLYGYPTAHYRLKDLLATRYNYVQVADIFGKAVDAEMLAHGYLPVDAKQIFHVEPGFRTNPHSTYMSDNNNVAAFEFECNYAKEGKVPLLTGIGGCKQDFDAAKANLMKVHFTDRFEPVIEKLTGLYENGVNDPFITYQNPMDRTGMLSKSIERYFEETGFTTDLSLGLFRYTDGRFEFDYFLDDQDEEFIYTVHNPRAIVTFLWEAIDPIVKIGKLNVSSTELRSNGTKYTISVSL